MADLRVNLLGKTLNGPVIGASGTFGYGVEYADMIDCSRLGGVCSKGLTLNGKPGNPQRPHQLHRPAESRRAALH